MFKKMTLANLIGFIICVLGVFLPWGERNLIPVMTGSENMLGIQLLLGQFTFAGACATELFHILYVVRGRRCLLAFTIISEMVVMVSPLIWIAFPGMLTPTIPYYSYKPLYGAYLSFVGGMVLLSGTLSSLVRQI